MGAIWDFISGKSTYWDEVDRKNAAAAERAREYRASHPIEREKKYAAYCKICGERTQRGRTFHDQASAIQYLQINYTGGCGRGNHTPEVHEV